MKLKIALIRHGETEKSDSEPFGAGNSAPLSENGKKTIHEKIAAHAYPTLKHVYSCELLCCRDTASLIYPFPVVVLRELNMATSNMKEIYEANVRAGNIIRAVGAEMEIKGAGLCALISHKMVILEILRRYSVPRSSYEDWKLPFAGGYLIEYDTVQETATVLSTI